VGITISEGFLVKSNGPSSFFGREVQHRFEGGIEVETQERKVVDVVGANGLDKLLAKLGKELDKK
jgi:hypothetical protein